MFGDKFLFYKGYGIPVKKTLAEYEECIEAMVS
jgi:hypothetical protein